MLIDDALISSWILSAWLPFVRIGGAVMAAPLFGSRNVPARVRLSITVLTALLLVPVLPPAPAVNPLSLAALLLAINELLLGLCIGFLIQLVFEAVVFAGQVIAMGMGLGFAVMVDPLRGVSVPVLSQYLLLIALLLFVAMGGHLEFLRVIAGSFERWPIGAAVVGPEALGVVIDWGADMLRGALQIALPAVVALQLVQLSVGVISRAAPTLNLFAVGFPIAMLMGYVVIEQVLPAMLPALETLFSSVFAAIARLLETAHG